MLRIYFLQQWYSLSDEGLEDALYDSIAMRAFSSIDLEVEDVPDATTLLKFRHLLLEQDLMRKLFDEIGISLCECGLMMKGRRAGRCDDHRSAAVDQKRREALRSGQASNEEGQRVALRHDKDDGTTNHRFLSIRICGGINVHQYAPTRANGSIHWGCRGMHINGGQRPGRILVRRS
jgi:IS5 family transposase